MRAAWRFGKTRAISRCQGCKYIVTLGTFYFCFSDTDMYTWLRWFAKCTTPQRLGSKQALSADKHDVPKLSWKPRMLSTNADSGGGIGITDLTMTVLSCSSHIDRALCGGLTEGRPVVCFWRIKINIPCRRCLKFKQSHRRTFRPVNINQVSKYSCSFVTEFL